MIAAAGEPPHCHGDRRPGRGDPGLRRISLLYRAATAGSAHGLWPTQGDEEWRDTTLLACPSFTVQQVQLTAPVGRGSEKYLISQ